MDRCGIFIDAGYLLAEAGGVCCGTKKRTEVICNYNTLIKALADYVSDHCGLPLLRIYWYDAAQQASPTPEHLTIAELVNIKVRLGRLSAGRQKGVDGLIYRDLMTLARERAIATAYLLAGDEDLREGVIAAQDMGTRVILIGVRSGVGSNQSKILIQEADDHLIIEKTFWEPHFVKMKMVTTQRDEMEIAKQVGAETAMTWAGKMGIQEVVKLWKQFPRIPKDLDVQLLKKAQEILGSLQGKRALRDNMRSEFWMAIKKVIKP
jgi:hypothetical protein